MITILSRRDLSLSCARRLPPDGADDDHGSSMTSRQVLVDFENVQPSFGQLGTLVPHFTHVWLFYGPHQAKRAQQWAPGQTLVTLVPRSGRGSNALDFHICFYMGYVAARHPDAELVVVANDRGYDPMLAHARSLKFFAKRVGFKPKTTSMAKVSAPGKAVNAALSKPVAPAMKSGPAGKAGAKRVPTAKMGSAEVKAPSAPMPTESGELSRITKALRKMGQERPTKLASFTRHIAAMMGKDTSPESAAAMVQRLQQHAAVAVDGTAMSYP